jgi:hypothetical protein
LCKLIWKPFQRELQASVAHVEAGLGSDNSPAYWAPECGSWGWRILASWYD